LADLGRRPVICGESAEDNKCATFSARREDSKSRPPPAKRGKLKIQRRAASLPTLFAVVLIIVIVFGAGYYLLGQGGGGQHASTQVGNTTLSSTTLSSTSASSIQSSSSASGRVIIVFVAPNVLASSDVVANYTMKVTTLGSVPTTLNLAAASPPGITVTLDPSQFSAAEGPTGPVASIQVDPGTRPGAYNVNVTASGGGQTYTGILSLQVVSFLVVTVGTLFVPANMTVPVNSTVYWMRLNGAISQYDNGEHNVVFLNDSLPSSQPLQQWESYSYLFTAPGDYPYYCTFHPFQKGEIVVTP
jgi:plastocyanin